ncbi:Tn7 transposase TnsA N-terminal domain-containing protein [Shewanella sp. 10N.286.45.A1]|uniref:Tn7 transposase TnsA N-terminal domain-containing protein n=1 Tax=Shewanella sp. 10N.286.45.A1 TaxID=3229694 RepID=UPI00354D638C
MKNLFKFASLKNRASLTLESSLEFDACFHFEYSKSVSAFEAQPIGFYYQYYGKSLPYTPDFLVSSADGKQIYYEIKYSKEACDLEVKERLRHKQQSCIELGLELRLITERQLRKGCSGQLILATVLEFNQNNRSDSLGVSPPLY